MITASNKGSLSLFISRKLEENSDINKLGSNLGISVIAEPLIKTVKVPFSHTPKAKWIFFSSKNAIQFFFEQNPLLDADIKYAVISKQSEQFLNQYGKSVDFVGEGVDLTKIAKQFRDVLKNDSVLFPQAMDSYKSVQKQIAFTNVVYNVFTYKTIIRNDFELPYTDILVFTSPSNVVAYFGKYKIDSRQKVIAMGSSTKYKLSEYQIKNVFTPEQFGEKGIYELLIQEVII
jgi:hydroxymethylbilane synthase